MNWHCGYCGEKACYDDYVHGVCKKCKRKNTIRPTAINEEGDFK